MIFSNFFKRILSIHNLKRKNYLFKPSLTFVGVGPGDPKLLTIAALDAISDASLVAFPIAKIGEKSVAASNSFASETFLLRRGSEATRYKIASLMM